MVREIFSSVAHVLRSHRCMAAKDLLRDSDLMVRDVARTVGYEDPDYFARCFQQETGLRPLAYRKRHRHLKMDFSSP